MADDLLHVQNLSVRIGEENAVDDISFVIPKGKITAIVGESGSGKSITALSIMQLLPAVASVEGTLIFQKNNEELVDIAGFKKNSGNELRGREIAMIFQEPMTSLNPVLTCGKQVREMLLQHSDISKAEARSKSISLFEQVGLINPREVFRKYPHELSGGQKQRVMIAMAISCNPSLLIADEPTTALDVKVQATIISLLQDLQKKTGMAILFISHDLALVSQIADHIIVMRKGKIVEQAGTANIIHNPTASYTKALLECRPTPNQKGKMLPVFTDEGDSFTRTETAKKTKENLETASLKEKIVLQVDKLCVSFPASKNFLGSSKTRVPILKDVSLLVCEKECVGIVGESGSGKTTLGRALLHLIKIDSGKILLQGRDISALSASELRIMRRDLQIVFQDPYGSLNPRITIAAAIAEPMKVHGIGNSKNERRERIADLLQKVNLQPDHMKRYPHQFSGGQRQRICIARALALSPDFLIFDESVSALDVRVQAQVLNIISDLRQELGFAALFISHDLNVVHHISDRIIVMQHGKIVEEGMAGDILFRPQDEYTKSLVEAIPALR